MARLIDADALKANLESTEEKEYATTGYILHMCDSLQIIDAAPAIDAIPVEWMDEKFMDVQNKDKALSRAAWLVLHAWQKEQEAHGT